MNVALVSEHASPLAALGGVDAGGQNVHVAALATALARQGALVQVYTRRDDPALPTVVPFGPCVEVVHLDAGPPAPLPKDDLLPHMAELAAGLRREWMRVRPVIAHAHFWMSGLATLRAADTLGIPSALTFHALGHVKRQQQGVKDTSPPARCGIERMLARRVDRLLATSNEEVFELARMGADRSRISLVPCGVDLDHFTPVGRREERRLPHRIVVVSRLVERKGIGNVIAAMAQLPDTELVVAGGPSRDRLAGDREAQRLMQLARTLGVADRVDLRGRVERDDVPALIRSADLVVCAPWYEPFGLVALEAAGCGVPVVATAVGGLVDSVIDGVTGRHVPPRDPAALATVVRELLDDARGRVAMGRAAVERVRNRYGWDEIARQTLAAYTATVMGAHPADCRSAG